MIFSTYKKSIFFCIALVILFLFSTQIAKAQAGVPNIISYQGRLTDSGGNTLGGTGTPYHFKFSFYDSPTVGSGTKVWPSSLPLSTQLQVKQGLFNVNIGDTVGGYPNTLDYNFNTNSKIYLQIEVSSDNISFETLSPRSLITSAPTAQVAGQVNGINPSSFGTTTPFINTLISAITTAINQTALTIRGIAGQVANLFNIQDSTGNSLFIVSGIGNVGIGTTTPNSLLTVAGNSNITGTLTIGTSDIYTFIGSLTNEDMFWGNSAGKITGRSGYGENIGIGKQALDGLTTGQENMAIGTSALGATNTGIRNTAIGASALLSVTSGSSNVGLGRFAGGRITTGSNNIAIGTDTFSGAGGGSLNNVGIGLGSVGGSSLSVNAVVSYNVGVGSRALERLLTGANNNTAIGTFAGVVVSTGANNILIGYDAGGEMTTGSNNIVIGYNVDTTNVTDSNRLNIGNLIFGTGVDGTGTTLSSGNVGIGNTSPGSRLQIDTGVATTIGQIIRGFTSQTANLSEWQDSAGAVLSSIGPAGTIGIGTAPSTNFQLDILNPTVGGFRIRSGTRSLSFNNFAGDVNYLFTTGAAFRLGTQDGNNLEFWANNARAGIFSTSGQFLLSNLGSAVSPIISYFADQDTGLFSPTADTIAWSTGGVERVRFDSSGNVGIGLLAPSEKLDVNGSINIPLTTASASAIVSGGIKQNGQTVFHTYSNNAGTADNLFVGRGSGNFTLGAAAINNMAFGISTLSALATGSQNVAFGQNALSATTDGIGNSAFGHSAGSNNTTGSYNVAFGRTALQNNLTGSFNVGFGDGALSATTGSNNTGIGRRAGNVNTTGTNNTYIGFGANAGTNNLTNATAIGSNAIVDASNTLVLGGTGANAVNVGIGTIAPSTKLHIANSSSGVTVNAHTQLFVERNTHARIEIATPNNAFGSVWFSDPEQNGVGRFEYDHTNNNLNFWSANTQRMTILGSGNVGIGTASPGARLQINTVVATTIGQIIQGVASQTANLSEWQNSGGTPQSSVDQTGYLRINQAGATATPASGTSALDVTGHTNSSDLTNSVARLYSQNRTQYLSLGWASIMSTGALTINPGTGLYIQNGTNRGVDIGSGSAGTVNARLYVRGQTVNPNAAPTGTVSTMAGSNIVTGVGTNLTNVIGGAYTITIGANTYPIASVDSATQVTLYTNALATVSGSAWSYTPPTGIFLSSNQQNYFAADSLGNFVSRGVNPQLIMDRTGGKSWSVGVDTANNGRWSLNNVTNSTVPFYVDGSAPDGSLIINSSGNVGIGTTTPSHPLHVIAAGSDVARFNGTGSTQCTVVAGTGWSCSSDESLKKDIEALSIVNYSSSSLDKIMELRPVSYRWNTDGATSTLQHGFIAQQLEQVLPDIVRTDTVSGLKSINITGVIPFLVDAFQEISHKVANISKWFSGDNANKFNVQGDVCVDDVCISKEQFKTLLQNSGGTPNNNNLNNSNDNLENSNDGGGSTEITPESEPNPEAETEILPESEPIVNPAPEPQPNPEPSPETEITPEPEPIS